MKINQQRKAKDKYAKPNGESGSFSIYMYSESAFFPITVTILIFCCHILKHKVSESLLFFTSEAEIIHKSQYCNKNLISDVKNKLHIYVDTMCCCFIH